MEHEIILLSDGLPGSVADNDIIQVESTETKKNAENMNDAEQKGRASFDATLYIDGPDQLVDCDNYSACRADGAVKLRLGEGGVGSYRPQSIPTMLRKVAYKHPNRLALAVSRNNRWFGWTYKEYYKTVRTVAKAFISLGLERFHGVCILGFNYPEWFFSELAAIFAGGIAAGIYTTNSPEACLHCMKTCKANIVVVEDRKQLEKILKVQDEVPDLKAVIQYTGEPYAKGVLGWREIIKMGSELDERALEERLKSIAINQAATIIFTSGTTGFPKGVMLSHDNLTWAAYTNSVSKNTHQFREAFADVVSYLPLSHIAAKLPDIYISILKAATVYFAQPDALKGSLVNTMTDVRPIYFFGVPRVFEKMYEKMSEAGKNASGVKKYLVTWARTVSLRYHHAKMRGDSPSSLKYKLARGLVLRKVKEAIGLDRCEYLASGAAPLNAKIKEFFLSIDLPVCEAYGLSESGGAHIRNNAHNMKAGSCGKTLDGCRTKIADPDEDGNGEVCMTGRHVFMGYLRNPEETENIFDGDGWLRSGDIGRMDNRGNLYITGRIKDIIITAGGENIPPLLIEDQVMQELPMLANCMLVGEKKKFLSMLLTIKTVIDLESGQPQDLLAPAALQWCRQVGSKATTLKQIRDPPDALVMEAIQDGIDKANEHAISRAQKIQKWAILPVDFSIPGGEVGPTMKVKRNYVLQKYEDIINNFYIE